MKSCERGMLVNRFMIGQYGGFDYKKQQRDFRSDFYGVEACLFSTSDDVWNLANEAKNQGYQIGLHYPFRSGKCKVRDALFLSLDEEVRNEAFEQIEDELRYVSECLNPTYMLFHYPKPVLLDGSVNWNQWRFGDKSEYVFESKMTFDEFATRIQYLFEWLTRKSQQYGFTPILEFDALNKYIYATDYLESLLRQYPFIRLCLDTARLFLQSRIDSNFHVERILRTYVKYADLLHLSNVQVTDIVQHSHFPVLPDLNPNDGWAPIEDYLKIMTEQNQAFKVVFEHRSDLISDEQLDRMLFMGEKFSR